jgi:hypothetical protein
MIPRGPCGVWARADDNTVGTESGESTIPEAA